MQGPAHHPLGPARRTGGDRPGERLLAARFYRRKDSPQGVLGNAEWGFARVSRVDPDVEALISPFLIPVIA
jgi:hypothetical protein